jgi:DNA-binding transcriptional regulator LsrR (DeoR family)
MRKLKEVIWLKLEAKRSHERIASGLGISKGVVAKYVGLASFSYRHLLQRKQIDP